MHIPAKFGVKWISGFRWK